MADKPADVVRALEEETRLIAEHTRLLDDETRRIEEQTHVAAPKHAAPVPEAAPVADEPAEDAPAEEAPAELEAPDPTTVRPRPQAASGESLSAEMASRIPDPTAPPAQDDFDQLSRHKAAQVDPTTVRPRSGKIISPTGTEHFVVRNTRDYDHDAQSVNVIRGATGRFETIHDTSANDARRDPYARSSRKGDAPGEGNSRSKLRPLLAMLLIALVLGGGGAVLSYGMELWGGKSMPSVVGESQANAEARIADKGLVAHIESVPADDAIGYVVSQDPETGVRMPEGSEVTIVVAAGRIVPDVVGMSEEEARAVLAEAGATNVTTVEEPSAALDGTVIAMSPEAGRGFVTTDEFTLTIAGWYHVPDVVGKKESDAVKEIERVGLTSQVTYVRSDKTVRTVIETSPVAGEPIMSSEPVQVMVSSPYPSDIHHLAEFFEHSSQDVDSFLQSKGYAFGRGHIDGNGWAVATYTSGDNGNITFSSQPYLTSISLPEQGSSNVLSTGAPIAGVRLAAPSSMVPKDYERSSLDSIIESCGLSGLTDTCSNSTIKLPGGSPKVTATFSCASGKMDNLVWTVLVSGSGKTPSHVSVTCAKEGLYAASALQPFGGSLCQYVAYQEIYLSNEYLAKEGKTSSKDDSKDDKKDNKDNDSKDKDDKDD